MSTAREQLRSRWQLSRWLLLVIGCCITWMVMAEDKGPHIPRGLGEHCVADTDFMRRDHMRLLIHQRDETVLRGIREEPFSLSECVDCHVQKTDSGEPIRVDAEGQFCQSCHAYAAVKIDCFGCHSALPEQIASAHQQDQSALDTNPDSAATSLLRLATYRYGYAQTHIHRE